MTPTPDDLIPLSDLRPGDRIWIPGKHPGDEFDVIIKHRDRWGTYGQHASPYAPHMRVFLLDDVVQSVPRSSVRFRDSAGK